MANRIDSQQAIPSGVGISHKARKQGVCYVILAIIKVKETALVTLRIKKVSTI